MKRAWLACLFLPFASCAIKRWKFSNDVLDPLNWEGGKPQKCKGVIFPENLGSVASVFELYTDEISLPVDGELEIREGGFVEFSENNPCLKIKPLKRRYWLSPSSWDYGGNTATPDAERVPCASDHVVFPSDKTISVFLPETSLNVNSLEIGGVNVSDEEWHKFLDTDYGVQQFVRSPYAYQAHITVRPAGCPSKGGCLCQYNEEEEFWVCENDSEKEDAACLDPVKPVGHCRPICGGILTLTTGSNFNLDHLKENIPKHNQIDSYASKVLKKDTEVIQVVFVEKQEYSELSTDVAQDFLQAISKDMERFGVISANLEVSGIPIPKGDRWATAFSIVFGTLVGVLCILTILYMTYVGPLERYNLRVPLKEISVRNWRPHLFARFENKEEGHMSVATSLMSLEKAFDNPMFGTQRPSTSSEALEVVVMEEPSTSETVHENPSYDLKIIEEVEE